MRSFSRFSAFGLLLLALLGTGCSPDSPTFAGGSPLIFTGTLAATGDFNTETFLVEVTGTVSIELTELVADDPETGEPIEGTRLAVLLGTPAIGGGCNASFTNSMLEGESVSVFLRMKEYCLSIARVGDTLPEDVQVEYVVTVGPAFG